MLWLFIIIIWIEIKFYDVHFFSWHETEWIFFSFFFCLFFSIEWMNFTWMAIVYSMEFWLTALQNSHRIHGFFSLVYVVQTRIVEFFFLFLFIYSGKNHAALHYYILIFIPFFSRFYESTLDTNILCQSVVIFHHRSIDG